MLKQTESQNTKLFTEKPLQIFNDRTSPLNSTLKGLLTRFSGLRLFEEESGSGLMTRGAQAYYFGDVQILQIPSMFYHPLYALNNIKAMLEDFAGSRSKNEQYNISLSMSLVTESEINEKLKRQRFLEFDFNITNASELDLLILKHKFDELKAFLKENIHSRKSLLGTEPRIKISSYVENRTRSNLLVFNSAFKTFDDQPVSWRDLPTIETKLSTLDLVMLIKAKNPEIYNMLIDEYVLSLNKDPRVIEQFVALLASKRSSFDVVRSKSNSMEYLTSLLDLAIERNGTAKVDQWIDEIRLTKHIPETDRSAFEEYMATKFMVDDIEMQHELFRKRKNQI